MNKARKKMNAEQLFREMFHTIWQRHDIEKLDHYYAKNFEQTLGMVNKNGDVVEVKMHYDYIVEQAVLQKENYRDTTLDIKKTIVNDDNHIAINFYSCSIHKKTGEPCYRYVCGIWRFNHENKIDRVWAVVTPWSS